MNRIMNRIIEDNIDKIKDLCKTYDVMALYVFGSAYTEAFHEESDIDFLLTFKDITIERYTDNYFNLHYELEALLHRKIDLITEKSISNPYLIQSIEETKKLLYAA